MKKETILTTLFVIITFIGYSQTRYFTKTGVVSFSAGTPVEDIDGINKSASCVIDIPSTQVEVAVLVKGFEFKRGLMQEHFNENYLESEKYPKAFYKGKINDLTKVDFKKDGKYEVSSTGTLDMHGIKKEIEVPAVFVVEKGIPTATINFSVVLADYKVEIPSAVKDKISKTAAINVVLDLKPLK